MSTEVVAVNGNGSVVSEDDVSDGTIDHENVPELVLNHVIDSVISKDDHEEDALSDNKTDVCSTDNAVIENDPEPPVRSHSRVSNASNNSKAASK